jgi:hypothetical protein
MVSEAICLTKFSKGNLTGWRKLVPMLLLGVPALLVTMKMLSVGGPWLSETLSLRDVPDSMYSRVSYIMFVPLGAVIVVLTRLTLGIRVLGPFRSILLAIAFQITGIPAGLVFMALVIGVVTFIRPFLKSIRIPYFGRVSVILSAVAAIMILTLIAGESLEAETIRGVAYFPIVVLCLAGDGFARTLVKEGTRSALWRGLMTAVVGIVITLIASVHALESFMLRYPEVLIFEIGLIMVIAEYFDLRLFQDLNPKPMKKKRKTSGKSSGVKKSTGKRKRSKSVQREKRPATPREADLEVVGAGRE